VPSAATVSSLNPQACIDGCGGAQVCPTLTVGAVENCINALGGDLCRLDGIPACESLDRCGGNDGGAG
jgi:hypothetical protein